MSETAQSPGSGTPDVPIPHEDNGGPASEQELSDLAINGIGSNASSPPELRPEVHPGTPPKTSNPGSSSPPPETDGPEELGGPGGGPAEPVEKIRRSSSQGRPEVELPPPGSPSPKPRAARESRKGTPPAEIPPATTPEKPAAAEETATPGPSIPQEGPATEAEDPLAQLKEGTTVPYGGSVLTFEGKVTRGSGDMTSEYFRFGTEDGGHSEFGATAVRQFLSEKAASEGGPTAEPEIATPAPTKEGTAAPQPETAEEATVPSPTAEEKPAAETAEAATKPPKPENKLEEQVEERFSRVKTGTVLSAGDKSWRIGRIEEKEIGGHPVTLYWTKRADGTPFSFSEGDVKELISDNLFGRQRVTEEKAAVRIRQEQANQQAAEKVAREAARADREKQLAAEKAEKEATRAAKAREEAARKEVLEKEKVERTKTFDYRVGQRLQALQQTGASAEVQRGKQTLAFVKYDSSISNPYKFKDEKGQTFNLAEAEVNKLLAETARAEDKAALEQLKPTHQKERPAAAEKEEAKKPEKPTPKWKERLAAAGALAEKAGGAVKKGAEVTPVTRILYNITNGFLNKFDLRDKDVKAWLAGAATGTLLTIGLDNFLGFLGVGPSRIIRSALSSGVIIGGSAGVNLKRNGAVGRILENYGVKDIAERKSYIQKFDTAFRLLRTGDEGKYHEAMRALSNEIFSKHGTAAHRGNVEYELPEAAAAELQKTIESLNTKYQKLNNTIRSFSAGLVAGTVGTGLARCFLLPRLESLLDRIHGGGHVTPVPGIEHGAPTHAPPVEGRTATPTPTPGLEHTPTPTPTPEVPHGVTPVVPSIVEPGHVPAISEIISNPDLVHSVGIHSGDTVGQIFVNSGQTLSWGPGNADLFGTHILANYDMLHTMHDNVVAAGLATSNFPTQEAVVNLIKAADAGDAASFQQLVDAAHWIPVGDNWHELTNAGVEVVKRRFEIP